jgi:hypothetical protein
MANKKGKKMKSEVFNDLLEDWYIVKLNRINDGCYGNDFIEKNTAYENLKQLRNRYKKSFEEEKEE